MLKRIDSDIVFIEAAIMFDSGYYKKMDTTVLIYAPKKLRIARVMKRDKLPAKEIERLMSLQMDEQQKLKMADIVVRNDGGKHRLIKGIQYMLGIVCSEEISAAL
jgi:dephospho-CoA kinase